jgi:hypothetical protein
MTRPRSIDQRSDMKLSTSLKKYAPSCSTKSLTIPAPSAHQKLAVLANSLLVKVILVVTVMPGIFQRFKTPSWDCDVENFLVQQ